MPCLELSEARPRFAGMEFQEWRNIYTALNEMTRNLSRESRFFWARMTFYLTGKLRNVLPVCGNRELYANKENKAGAIFVRACCLYSWHFRQWDASVAIWSCVDNRVPLEDQNDCIPSLKHVDVFFCSRIVLIAMICILNLIWFSAHSLPWNAWYPHLNIFCIFFAGLSLPNLIFLRF